MPRCCQPVVRPASCTLRTEWRSIPSMPLSAIPWNCWRGLIRKRRTPPMFDDHERFMNKNRKLAQGYETSRLQEKVAETAAPGETTRPVSCFNCKKKHKCIEFKQKS